MEGNDGPIRTCAGCRSKRPQPALIRVAVLKDGAVTVDAPGAARAQGRGAYVCPDPRCIDQALRTGGLRRTLRCEGALPEDLRSRLMGRIDGPEAVDPART